jgi:hypothetical protein
MYYYSATGEPEERESERLVGASDPFDGDMYFPFNRVLIEWRWLRSMLSGGSVKGDRDGVLMIPLIDLLTGAVKDSLS